MNNLQIVHPGILLEEYFNYYNIEIKVAAKELEISEMNLKKILKGNLDLTLELASKLDLIFDEIPSNYWVNYVDKYNEQLSKSNNKLSVYNPIQLKQYAKRFKFNKIFKGLDWDIERQAKEMLKLLKLKNFEEFEERYSKLEVSFMEDGGQIESIAIWLSLIEEEIEIQNPNLDRVIFNREKLIEVLPKLKLLALNKDYGKSIISVRKLLNKYGIYLAFHPPIENSKVRGALATYRGNPVIYLTGRFNTHDHVWFALMHEVGHLIMHYNPEEVLISFEEEIKEISLETRELEANQFARDFFIDSTSYESFVNESDFSKESIIKFAQEMRILPGIVVARLQRDGKIGYEQFNYLK